MVRKLAMAMVVSGALGSSYANALGLGEIKLNSALNQPLDAEVKLLNVGDLSKNEILPNLGSHNDFSRAGVERVFFLTGIKFDVELDGKGGAVVHLTTDRIVREPFLNFLIELHWPSGRLLREYTAFLDPPLFSEAAQASIQQAATAAPTTTTVSVEPALQSKPYSTPSVSQSSSQSAPTPASSDKRDGTVRVKKNDTLWGIAKENRPDSSVTVRQTMVAIQQHNPQAFIKNNINLLKSGQVLRIPEAEEIRRVSSRDAYAETVRQTQEWESKKTIDATQKYYSAPTSKVAATDQGGLLKLVPSEGDPEADNSTASASGGSAAEGGTDVGSPAAGESSGSTSSALEDVDALQKQLDDLQRLMTLKQEQLALLQVTQAEEEAEALVEAELAAAAEEAVVTETDSSIDDSDVVKAVVDESIDSVADEKVMTDTQSSQEISETAGVSASSVDEATTPATPAQEQPRPQQGIVDILLNNPLYIGVLVVVILGGLILLGAISRRRKEEQEEYPQDFQEAIDSADNEVNIPDELGEDLVDVEVDSAGSFANAEPPLDESAPEEVTDETRKLLDESDIFIAYGRYERVIEILQPAVNNAPKNSALRLKLAETYLLNNDDARFSQQESDLQAIGDADALTSLDALKAKYSDQVAAVPEQQSELEELDFNIDFEESTDQIAEESTQDEALVSFDVAPEVDVIAEQEFGDLEFELSDEDVEIAVDGTAAVEELHENLVDFKTTADDDFLDIDAGDEVASEGDEALEFDLDNYQPESEQASSVNADDMDFLVDTDESATKLELAKAYIDMADADAAQEILNEVVSEGSEAQQQEARKLLENLE